MYRVALDSSELTLQRRCIGSVASTFFESHAHAEHRRSTFSSREREEWLRRWCLCRCAAAVSIAQSIFLRETSHGQLASLNYVPVFTPKQHVKRLLRRRLRHPLRAVLRHPQWESRATPSALARIQRNVLKRQEGARVDWSGEPRVDGERGAGSFARLVVPLWPPSRLGLLVVALNLVRPPRSPVKIYRYPRTHDRSRDPGSRPVIDRAIPAGELAAKF